MKRKIKSKEKTILGVLYAILFGNMLFSQTASANLIDDLQAEPLWYEQPYFWIAAACFFLLLMFLAIKRSEKN